MENTKKYVKYSIKDIVSIDKYSFLDKLCMHVEGDTYENCKDGAAQKKIDSWVDCLDFLKRYLSEHDIDMIGDISICFEYEIFDGTWIDVVIVCENKLIILEFKSGRDDREETLRKHQIQVTSYYNKVTRCNKNIWHKMKKNNDFSVEKYLIYTNPEMQGKTPDIEYIKVYDEFRDVVNELNNPTTDIKVEELLEFNEELDLTTIGVMRDIFKNNLLDEMYIQDNNVKACADIIENIINDNDKPELNIIFVKGSPGTGKTGTAFSLLKEYLDRKAKYVTGNRNLTEIFNEIISKEKIVGASRAAVGSLHCAYNTKKFCIRYKDKQEINLGYTTNDLLIIDEAQRMWNPLQIAIKDSALIDEDKAYVIEQDISEALLVLHSMVRGIGKDKKSKTVVFLIGSGQEIYVGEEGGEKQIEQAILKIYDNSIQKYTKLKIGLNVYVPTENMAMIYRENEINCEVNDGLLLKENKRNTYSNAALEFVNGIIDNNNVLINSSKKNIKDAFYVYNDFKCLEKDINEVKNVFSCGIVINSFESNYRKYKIEGKTISEIPRGGLYKFYVNRDSNKLEKFASQFNCQGLEFDYSIMVWGKMMVRRGDNWVFSDESIYQLKNYCEEVRNLINKYPELYEKLKSINEEELKEMFVKNCYRVLLTRVRIATHIYVEDKETYEHLSELIQNNI